MSEVHIAKAGEEKEARWYQIATVNGVNKALESGRRRIHVKLPTQTGKTYTTGMVLTDVHFRHLLGVTDTRKLKVLWLAHKSRLLTQAKREVGKLPGVELILQSAFQPLPDEVTWDVCVMDECHHEAMMSIQMKIDDSDRDVGLNRRPIIGLTATDDRPDGLLIKFDATVECLTRQQAVAEGFLAKTELQSIIDYGKSKDRHLVVADILRNYRHKMEQTMIFMPTRIQASYVGEVLEDLGESYVVLLDQGPAEMDRILDSFSEKGVRFIVNCSKIDEGVDVTGGTDLILAKQYGSYPQLNQVIGRVSKPDSPCRVWEFMHPFKESLTALNVIGEADAHRLYHRKKGEWRVDLMPASTAPTHIMPAVASTKPAGRDHTNPAASGGSF